ncbi:MAG: hypothetical protein SGBAC_007208 [Bacillariaceae sp.]
MTNAANNRNDEENNLKEALLDKSSKEPSTLAPAGQQFKEVNGFIHWSPCKKVVVLVSIMLANSVAFCCTMRSLENLEPLHALPLQEGALASWNIAGQEGFLLHQEDNEEEQGAMKFEILKIEDAPLADRNASSMTTATTASTTTTTTTTTTGKQVQGPIPPPFHPHHSASVTYSSQMGPDGHVEYRRDINAPCEFGMLLFSVGPAKDDLPYTYELYNDAYLYSDNNGLCMFYPSYNGYQTSSVPLQSPSDPLQVILKPLDKSIMHWISSRVFDPHRSNKKWDRTKVGDYAIIAKHNFYNPGYYKGLKAEINAWK